MASRRSLRLERGSHHPCPLVLVGEKQQGCLAGVGMGRNRNRNRHGNRNGHGNGKGKGKVKVKVDVGER